MSFETVLQMIVDECGGGRSAALMGLDGIAIAEARASAGVDDDDPLDGDVTTAGIEFGRIIGEMTKASDSLGTGHVRESVLSLDRSTMIFHTVDEDLILVLSLHPDGNLGKARYLIRRGMPEIRAEL
jgi:predicted regulator of Ras-like GTPase activity (Roadblock/LC7/MglB family)